MHSGNDSIESDPEFGISREKTLDELIVEIEADPYVSTGLRRAEILNVFDDFCGFLHFNLRNIFRPSRET